MILESDRRSAYGERQQNRYGTPEQGINAYVVRDARGAEQRAVLTLFGLHVTP